ncbi:MAG: hypothetical protein H7A34_02915 [bacterium]|nr:hypothetical protein [bacterium]
MFVRERLVSLKKRVVYCVFAWAFAVAAYAVEYDNDVQSQLELLPYKYSRLNKLKVSDNDSPWVIHITDYHCQYELQQNISKIIYFIANKNRNIPVPICIEGASGAVSTAFFSSIPHEKTRNEVSNYFLKKGKISGAEFYAITADTNQQLYGVDDPGLYNRSYELYREVHHTAVKLQPQFQIISDFFKNGIQQRLSTQSKTIVMAGKKLYSESNVKRFIVSMEPYWSRLEPTSDFSAIKRYYELERLVSAVDFKKVNELKKKLFERLAAILPADQREKILFNTYVRYQLNEISEPVYLRHLAVLGEEYNILDRDYAELMHVTQLLEEIAGFNHEQLLEQCILMYDTLKNHFLTPVERQFVMFYEQWNIIEEMCVLGLSRNDFVNQQFPDKDARDRLLMYVLSAIGDSNSSDKELLFPVEFYAAFNQLYNDVSSFYQSAIARDSALANNTVSLIQTHKVPIVILVTGGFHTNGMMDIFEKEHLNYAVINPHGLEFTAQSNYKSIMMEYPQGAMQLLYSPQSNRLAPRVLLKNILADPILSQQLMKEAALMAKLLAMTEADTLSGFSMAEVSYDSNAFKKKVTDTLKSFTSEWIYRLRKAMPQHGESPADVRKMENSLLQLVLIEESLLLKDGKSIGLTVFDADTETFVHVDAAETASLNTILNYDSALFPDAPVTFDLEERLGSFTFRFTRTQQPTGIF